MNPAKVLRQTHVRSLCFAVGLCMLLASGCSRQSADESAASSKTEVTLARVVRADISQTLSLNGTAAGVPNQDVRVSALVSGRVAELSVAEGDRVHTGQVLARLDNRVFRGQLQGAQAAEQQAKANFDNAQLALARNEDLYSRGVTAQKELENSRTQQAVAAATLQQADAALELAKLQVARCEIVSPLNGAVAKRFVSVGEQVDGTAAQPIVEVANLAEIEFLGNAPAMYLAKMHPGETVYVTSESVPGQKFAGRVEAISPAVDPATGVGLVRIRIPNPNGMLRLGIFLSAEIAVDTRVRVLTVPAEAIYRDSTGQPRVFVVQQDSATAVPVKLGIETKDRVELVDDAVKEGSTVILAGGYGLADTAKIQTKPQSNP
jgi:membrane fusion protein, multidrug efflux system